MKQIDYSKTVKNLRQLLKDYIIKSNLKSLVIGVSGGIDSALVCALAKPVVDELNIPLVGRSISIKSNKEDEKERARNIGKHFCTDFKEIDLSDLFTITKDYMMGTSDNEPEDKAYKIRMGNIKARMRMTYLYNLASEFGGLVLSTDNMTELNLGFWTICGDVGDYGLIQELWKTEVYGMTEWLAANELIYHTQDGSDALNSCITCDATDGLGITKTDLDQILPDWKDRHTSTRSGYSEVDEIFISYFETVEKLNNTIPAYEKSKLISLLNIMNKSTVIQRHFKTEFKRNHPYNEKRIDFIV